MRGGFRRGHRKSLGSSFSRWNSFGDYEEALRTAGIGGVVESGADIGVKHDPRQAVLSTFELSLDSLAKAGNPQARPLLRLLSCYAPGVPVPVGLLDNAQREPRLSLRNLARLSLVSEHSLPVGGGPRPAHFGARCVAAVAGRLTRGRARHPAQAGVGCRAMR